jgi:Type I phosphodiesterase / nucleotide pyrophosphatase
VLLCAGAACCVAQEQYPKPLIHTATDHPAARVILLSVGGLHAVDLANWVSGHPHSTLAELSKRGVTYTNAHTTAAEPAAGLVSLATGGTPISTGIVSDDGFDHALSPPDPGCQKVGALLNLNGAMEAAGGLGLDSLKYPRDAQHGCTPIPPHSQVRVNTMFEVVHTKIGPTAWIGESATATDMLRGPSGLGIDDSCGVNRIPPMGGELKTAQDADDARVAAMLHWIDAKDCTGKLDFQVPALFGMSFVSVAVAQAAPGMGYTDAAGTPSAGLAKSLAFVDEAIGKMVKELKAKELYDSTWIFVTSPYGQSPMDPRSVRHIPLEEVRLAAESVRPGLVAHISGGDVAMIWLSDPAKTDAVVKAYGDRAAALGIREIYSGARLALTLNAPAKDSRMPDIILQPELGVLWGLSNDKNLAGYGGTLDEDTHVALLVSGDQLTGRFDPTWVPTTQLAPLLLRALGMEKFDLDALHLEHSPALPGIF